MERLAIAGGGTGGHIYPGIAVAREAAKAGAEVMFIGVETGIEARVVPAEGFRLVTVRAGRFRGMGIIGRLKTMATIPAGVLEARRALREFRPDVLLGVGGYASLSGVLAARLLGVPVVLQEQNAIPGLANRVLCRFADIVALGFVEAGVKLGAARRCVHTGNPVRELGRADRAVSLSGFGLVTDKKTVLVFGGSAGAMSINRAVCGALEKMAGHVGSVQFIHQTGGGGLAEVEAAYGKSGFKAAVLPYIDDMAAAYACADLVVCRAGAMSLAEVTSLGKPAILIPYPYATDNHQEMNARVLERAGAARVLLDRDATGDGLADEVLALVGDEDRLSGMAGRSRSVGRPEAAREVLNICMEYSRT